MAIARYIGRRLFALLVVVLAIAIITFFVTHLLPGDPATRIAGIGTSPEQIAKVRHSLGLDRPLWAQFVAYLRQLFTLDFGTSVSTQRPIAADIAARLPATIELALFSVVIYVIIAIVIGLVSGTTRHRWVSDGLRIGSVLGASVPPYWMALVMQIVFYSWLGLLPSGQRLNIADIPPRTVTGLYTVDSLLTGNWADLGSALVHLILPVASLVIGNVGTLGRLIRAQAIDELGADYVRTARAKGLTRRAVNVRHILPNSVNPSITVIGIQVGFLLAGTVYVEQVFQWPGLGSYTWDAVVGLDYSAVLASAVVLSVIFVVISFLVDIIYQLVDPRLRAAS